MPPTRGKRKLDGDPAKAATGLGRRHPLVTVLALVVWCPLPFYYLLLVAHTGETFARYTVVDLRSAAPTSSWEKDQVHSWRGSFEAPPGASPIGGEIRVREACGRFALEMTISDAGPGGRVVWNRSYITKYRNTRNINYPIEALHLPPGSYRVEFVFAGRQPCYARNVPEVFLDLRRNVTPISYTVLGAVLVLTFAVPIGVWVYRWRKTRARSARGHG